MKILALFVSAVLATTNAFAATSPLLAGMTDARLMIYPSEYKDAATRAFSKRLTLSDASPNVISVSVNVYQGGMINGNRINFGSVQLEIYRPGTVSINGKPVVAKVGVWSASENVYSDDGFSFVNPYNSIESLASKAFR
jgi:hypothetical protein